MTRLREQPAASNTDFYKMHQKRQDELHNWKSGIGFPLFFFFPPPQENIAVILLFERFLQDQPTNLPPWIKRTEILFLFVAEK